MMTPAEIAEEIKIAGSAGRDDLSQENPGVRPGVPGADRSSR